MLFAKGLIRSAVPSLLTFPFVGQGREKEDVWGGYWIQAGLLTKHFQQVKTCFWICNSHSPSSPSPSACCRPPVTLPAVHSLVVPHFHFSRIDFTPVQGRKALLWRSPVTLIFIFSSCRLYRQWLETREGMKRELVGGGGMGKELAHRLQLLQNS